MAAEFAMNMRPLAAGGTAPCTMVLVASIPRITTLLSIVMFVSVYVSALS